MNTLQWRRENAGSYASVPVTDSLSDSWFTIHRAYDDGWNVFQVHPRYNSKDELLSVHTQLIDRTATLRAGKAAAQRKQNADQELMLTGRNVF